MHHELNRPRITPEPLPAHRILATLLLLVAVCPADLRAQNPVVYRVYLNGSLGLDASRVVDRALHVAREGTGSAVVLEMQSPGSRFDMAQLIVEAIESSDVPVYVLVTENAWGAAALVALAGDSLFMAPSSTIGAGTASDSELAELSVAARNAVHEEFRALAERKGMSVDVVTAMAPAPGNHDSSPATYTAEEARAAGLAHGPVDNLDSLLSRVGLAGREVITVGTGWTGTTVEIENNNTRDVRIYVLRGGTRYSLGLATSMRLIAFELPIAHFVDGARIRVLAEVIGSSDRLLTEIIRVEPGLVVRWVLQDPLRYSSYSFFVRQY